MRAPRGAGAPNGGTREPSDHHTLSATAPGLRRAIALGLTAITGTAILATASPAVAACPCPPEHAVIDCDSASFYTDYYHGIGPVGFKYTVYRGNKFGHTRGAHPVYNGWAASYDFGKTGTTSNWGYVRYNCLGGWNSW